MADQTAQPVRVSVRATSQTGDAITPESSLSVSAVLAAITVLAEDLSSLPLILYARRGRNKVRVWDSHYYRLLHDQPNPEQSSMVFRELMMSHLLAYGNFYGQLILDKRGEVAEIWALRPDRMTVQRKNGERIYTYQKSDGKPLVFFADELIHIPAFGFDGLVGYSRIALARNAIGLSMSTETYGSKFFANGANPGMIYKHPGILGDGAYERLKESLDARTGADNAHKTIILEENMSVEKIGIPPDDAQFLETRKFQVSEIARIFRVPPHMIGDVERSTSWGSGIDSQEQGYVNHTLRPWARRIEEYLGLQVIPQAMRVDHFVEHLMDGLLRGDIATRYEAYVKAINNGIMSPNEVRSKENMNPYKEGDTYWRPQNMEAVDNPAPTIPAPAVEPARIEDDDMEDDDADDQTPDDDSAAAALKPLWSDALGRIARREANDLRGALSRLQKSGDIEAFCEFVESFYADHGDFALKQLTPVVNAEFILWGNDLRGRVADAIRAVVEARREEILNAGVDDIADVIGEARLWYQFRESLEAER